MAEIVQITRLLFLSIFSFFVALILTKPFLIFIKKFNFGKQIRVDENAPIFSSLHKSKEGTPTMGGVIIWGTTLILTLGFFILSYFFDGVFDKLNFFTREQTLLPFGVLIGAALIGLLDDILGVLRIGPKGGGLRMRDKILIYTIIALLGAGWFLYKLDWDIIRIPFFGTFAIGSWYILVFGFVVVACAFSLNQSDGLDGLAGGISLSMIGFLTIVAFLQGKYDLASFLAVLGGSLAAFLWFNIFPAQFFMGDTGSMSLGIFIGVLAMYTNTWLLLLFYGFILIVESASTILQALAKKLWRKKIFLSTPIHHHFEALGLHESTITMRFWIISAIGSILAIIIYFLDKFIT